MQQIYFNRSLIDSLFRNSRTRIMFNLNMTYNHCKLINNTPTHNKK